MPVTDWHKLIRDAVRDGVEEALDDAGLSFEPENIIASNSLNARRVDCPGVICTYGSTEGIGGGTNAREDMEFPIMVGYFTLDPDSGDDPPGCKPSLFRAILREKFHNRRAISLADPGIYLFPSTMQPVPNINNDNAPAVENLRTAVIINVPARVARGTL